MNIGHEHLLIKNEQNVGNSKFAQQYKGKINENRNENKI